MDNLPAGRQVKNCKDKENEAESKTQDQRILVRDRDEGGRALQNNSALSYRSSH